MKKFLIPSLFIVFAITAAFGPTQHAEAKSEVPLSLGEFLYTVTLNKDMSVEDAQYRWFHEYLEPGVNDSVFEPLLDLIDRKLITVYEPSYPFQTIMSEQEAAEIFMPSDTVIIEDPNNPSEMLFEVVRMQRHANEILSITFHERWEYDPIALTLNKIVLGIIPNIELYDNATGMSYVKSTCYIPINNQPSNFTTISVNGITSDFIADGSEHSDWYLSDSIVTNKTVNSNQAKVTTRILGDITARASDKSFIMYEPEFPFTHQVEKNGRADKTAKLAKSNMLTFYEDWEINPRQRVFRKKVKGVMPQSEFWWTPDNGNSKWTYENSALIPFNGFGSVALNSDVCVIDKMSYDVFYKSEKQVRPKEMSLDDSAFLDTITADIREHVKRMEIKSFGPMYSGGWCDAFTEEHMELDKQQVHDLFYRTDTLQVENPETGDFIEKPVEFEHGHDQDCGLRFYENWAFNFKEQTFSKQTQFIGMDSYKNDDYQFGRNYAFIYFYQCPLTTPEQAKSAKYLYRSSVYSGSLLNWNEFHFDESDNGEKIVSYYDNWHENIDPSKRYALIQPVIDQVRAGTMKAFGPGPGSVVMKADEFGKMLKDVASASGMKYKPGMEFALFNQVFFEEEWYYNRVDGQIYKEVNAITFARAEWDKTDPDHYVPATQSYFTIRLKPAQ